MIEAIDESEAIDSRHRELIEVETYHALFWRLIRSQGVLLNLPRKLNLLTPQAEAVALSAIRNAHGADRNLPKSQLAAKKSALQQERLRLAFETGEVCFDLFAKFSADLFEKSEKIRAWFHTRYPVIIVDEFQDTNLDQFGSNTAHDRLNIGNVIYGTGLASGSTPSSTGKVGIGVGSPSNALHVHSGGTELNTWFQSTHSTNCAIQLSGAYTDTYSRIKESAGQFYLEADIAGAAGNSLIGFKVDGSLKARIDGDGLKFNADTAAANALDDYEEGTWTPTIGGTSNSGQSYETQTGQYTKIGNKVFCSFNIDLSAKGTISGFLKITGFPFAVSDTNAASFSYTSQWYLTADHHLQGTVYGTNILYLFECSQQADVPSQLSTSALVDSTICVGSFFFTTTD